ncbi:MAG TPA: type II secretion system F family protein [Terriglobales bacterium]|jgi:tight adherence protein C|nr:type II secretion system F family protein [Terriglobales bacterium]
MPLALAIFVFVAIVVTVFAFGAAAVVPSSVLGSRLREIGWQRPKAQAKPVIRERIQQALDPLSRALPTSPSEVSKTRLWLIQAGYRNAQHASIYRGLRVLFAALGFLSVFVFTGFNSPLLLVGVTALGFFIPRFLLKKKLQERQQRLRLGLPDALDLTVICVEAGLSLDQAMMRVGEDLRTAHPELSGEFHLFDLEARAGKPRVEALRNLAERTGVDDIRALVGTLIQTDRFGTSVAQALRVHSESLRTERRQRAEEQAAKTTVKMIIPLVLFVMPSLIFVTVGPAVIQLMHIFMPVAGGKR